MIDGSHLGSLGITGKRFNALFNGALGEALPCSQQKLQPDQYITYSYRHVRGYFLGGFREDRRFCTGLNSYVNRIAHKNDEQSNEFLDQLISLATCVCV